MMKLPRTKKQRRKVYLPVVFVLLFQLFLQYPRQCRSFSLSSFTRSAVSQPKFPSVNLAEDEIFRALFKQEKIAMENNSLLARSTDMDDDIPTTTRTFNCNNIERRGRQNIARTILAGIVSSFLFTVSPEQSYLQPPAAFAFDNGVPEMVNYKNIPKHPGTTPSNLGMDKNNGKLAICDGALNCFSTTGDDTHLLQPWTPKGGTSKTQAMDQLVDTIKSYPPGQARIDKAGFKIVSKKPEYLYVQFESGKHGFIDDVEFAVSGGDSSNPLEVQVRSASRMGFLDLGVNGKRLNWISNHLVETYGWRQTNKPITPESYPDYFPMMPFSFDDYIRSVLSPETCPVPANPLECKDPESGPA